jgi:putative endonuclease
MSATKQALGREGERIAELWLVQHGWRIVNRRFRTGHRDIDLVATRFDDNSRLVAFVEVKARRTLQFGGPAGAVGWRKQRQLVHSAQVWACRFGEPGDTYRFDVVAVLMESRRVRICHVENAFQLSR